MMPVTAPAEVITVESSRLEESAQLGILGESSIFDAPFTINSYGREIIERQGSVSANQVIKNDPALTNVSTSGGFSGYNLSFRGFPAGADAISFDGMGPGAMFSGSLGQLYSVERLEVVKGPSSALGTFSPQASVGGSVNIVPKKPLERPLTALHLGYRERGILSAHVDVSRKLSDKVGLRLNLAAEKGETYYAGNDERRVAALALSYRVTEDLSLDFGYDLIHVRSDGYQNAFVLAPGVGVPKAPNPRKQHFQPWSYLQQQWNYGYATLRWKLDETTKLTISAMQGDRRRPILSTGTGLINNESGDMTLRPISFAPGTAYEPFYGSNVSLSGLQETGPIRHEWNAAFLYSGFDFKSAVSSPIPTIDSNLYTPVFVGRPALNELATGRASRLETRSYALTDTMSWDEHWRVVIGVKNTTLNFANYDVTSGTQTLKQNDTASSPLAALSYRFNPDLSSFISYAQGLEIGGVAPSSASNGGEILPSILSEQWELGTKARLGRGLLLNTSVFQIERDLEYLESDTNRFVQSGLQRNRGLELNVQGELTPDVRLNGGFMVLDAKIVRSGVDSGKRPPGVPHWTLPLSADYRFAPDVTATLAIYHFDRQYVDPANTRELKAWTRYDAGLSHQLSLRDYRLSLSAYVENIGNQAYWASAAGGQLALGGPEIWKFALKAEI